MCKILAQEWVHKPYPIPGCPPGLEILKQVDKIYIQQQISLLEGKQFT